MLLRAAIYARKSNDDDHKCPDNKSITRQIDRARDYAEKKGFIVSEEHIFYDDGISGAEFNKRPGLSQLRLHAKEFDILVMSELSRLGRDANRTTMEVIKLREQGVRIFCYLKDQEEKADDATSRLVLQIHAFSSEIEREKTSERVSDSLNRKAEKGQVTGKPVYGYDSVPVFANSANGELTKSHSEYQINEPQAKVIRAIFEMYRDGYGYTKIALILNGDTNKNHIELRMKYLGGEAPPPPKNCTSGSWSMHKVRDLLDNDRYTGFVTYGKTTGVYKGGSKDIIDVEDYIKTPCPELTIIDSELWDAVSKRRADTAQSYKDSRGGALPFSRSIDTEADSSFILSGLCTCEECGFSFVTLGGTSGSGSNRKRYYKYGCSGRHNRGNKVCTNDHKIKVDDFDDAVLKAIETQLLTKDCIDYIVTKAQQIIESNNSGGPDRRKLISKELAGVDRDIEKLIDLVMKGVESEILAAKIKKKEEEKQWLESEKIRLQSIEDRSSFQPGEIRAALGERMSSFRSLLKENVAGARKALKMLLKEKIVVKPILRDGKKSLEFSGVTTVGALSSLDDEENHMGFGYPCITQ